MAALAMVITEIPAAHADVTTGIISYWPLDAINGSTTPDYGSSNVVNIVGSPTLVAGQFTNAFSFPSSPTSYFTTYGAPTPTGLPIYKSANGYSVAFWVKAAAQTSHYVYTESSTASSPLFIIGTGTSAGLSSKIDIYIRLDNGSTYINHVTSTSVVFDNNWHHVAWTDNHGVCALYVDGALDPQTYHYTPGANTITLNTTTVAALVRGTTISAAFTGTVDDVVTWQRPITQAEVQQVMSNSIPLPIVQSKPIITSISPNSTNAMGEYVTLNVAASGSSPITYQWYLNGQNLSGQTGNSLLITTLTNSGAYLYKVIASNLLGIASNTITLTVPPDAAVSLTNGLAGYWPLDVINSSSSFTTPDIIDHNDLLLGGLNSSVPVTGTGEFTNDLTFDGSQSQYAFAGGVPVYDTTNYSVSLWVNGAPASATRVFAEASTNSATPLFTIAEDASGSLGKVSLLIRNDANNPIVNNLAGSLTAFDSTWHHIVWVDQNGHALLYVDGVLDPVSFSYTRSGTFSLNDTAIGALVRASAGNAFTGQIDDVAMWNRRISYTEIMALQTNPVPTPTQINPPSIVSFTVSPADTVNNLYVGDTLTISTRAVGTTPLYYQWYKDNQPISVAANPSAGTPTLVVSGLQTTDGGAYYLSVSNSDPVLPGGAVVNSATVQVMVQAFTPVTNGLALDLDIDALGSPNTQPGFQMYTSALAGTAFANGIKVTLSPFNTATALGDRLRTGAVSNTATITQAALYNDFEYGAATNIGSGVTIELERLAPNTPYGVTIWSFDAASANPRYSDWTEVSSGIPIVIQSGYNFNGLVPPTADYDDTLGALLTSSATGKLQIQGVISANEVNGVSVFVNAIQLVAQPALSITNVFKNTNGNLQLTAVAQYPGQPIVVMTTTDLASPNWQPVANAISTTTHGPMTTVEIPFSQQAEFFGVASQ